jgi:signal transduction histidine kinase
MNAAFAQTETEQEYLQNLEDGLFSGLRNERQLESAYLSFAGDPPRHSFTLPLRYHGEVRGAVIGLQQGERTIISEEMFLEALSALLALNSATASLTGEAPIDRQALDEAKIEGIHHTAVTANHEINNALTPIVGIANLLRTGPGVTEDMKEKLKKIEVSADRIRNVLQRLMRVDKPDSVVYYDNIKMIPLPPEDDLSDD